MLAVMIIIMFGCLLLGFPMFMSMVLSSIVAIFGYLELMQPSTIVQQLMGFIAQRLAKVFLVNLLHRRIVV